MDNGLEILDVAECTALLDTRSVGRVGVTMAALPAIFPVNYCMLGGDIYFWTGPGTKLSAAADQAVVAFEVDDWDSMEHTGWSVLVIGRSEVISEGPEGVDLASLPVHPWAGGERHHAVMIHPEFVSGRRVGI